MADRIAEWAAKGKPARGGIPGQWLRSDHRFAVLPAAPAVFLRPGNPRPAVNFAAAIIPPPLKSRLKMKFAQHYQKVLTSPERAVKLVANAETYRCPLLLRLYLSAQTGGGLSLCVQRATTDIPRPAGLVPPAGGFYFARNPAWQSPALKRRQPGPNHPMN